jgi:phosphoribosylformylglycinamidine cyclo-ligase
VDYRDAGVDIGAADAAVARIAHIAARTFGPRVLSPIGGFGALYDVAGLGGARPTLVATTDGVGTKTEVARAGARYEGLGQDLVAMCVDDLVTTGARPLFFLDYLALGAVDPALVALLVSSMADALAAVGASLIGGEIAEHPGVLEPGQVDLAGFCIGIVDLDHVLGPERVRAGDRVLGLPSPNLRSNGFSLVRRVWADVLEEVRSGGTGPLLDDGRPLYDALVEPSVLYAPTVLSLMEAGVLHAAAHVTGGGLAANLVRVLPDGLGVEVVPWSWPEIFRRLAADGGIELAAMRETFNLGVGMALVVPADAVTTVRGIVGDVVELGIVEPSTQGVQWSSNDAS